MSEIAVDYQAMADLAGRLRCAAAGFEAWGGAIPAPPGAGAGSVHASVITAHLLEQLAHLTLTLESAAEALGETQAAYAAADESARTRGAGLGAAM